MKRLTLIFLPLLLGLPLMARDTLKVMSYNLRFGELASMEAIGEAISAEAPDIVMLQECDWATYRERAPKQNGVKFINVLASASGMFGVYAKSIDYKKGYYGIGVLSRYPVVKTERILLPNDGKTEQRTLLIVEVELPSGKTVTACCTHLEVKSSEMRLKQVKFIEKRLKKLPAPVFLAGDMNAEPDSPEMVFLRKYWLDCTNRELTFSTMKPSIKIDYIYARPSSKVKFLGAERITRYASLSDHFPVTSTFTLY